jgi:hypothetical protein
MGGMIYGMLLAFMLIRKDKFSPKAESDNIFERGNRVSQCCTGLVLGSFAVSLIALFSGDGLTAPCEACQAISCVEFPPWANVTDKWWYCDNCEFSGADLRSDEEAGKYDLLELYCPDGTMVDIDIDYYMTDEASYTLSSNLPSYCRLYC